MKVDVGDYEAYLGSLRPSPLVREPTPAAPAAQQDMRVPSADARAFYGAIESEQEQLARNTNAFYGKLN